MFIVKVLTQNIAYTLDREFFYLSNEKVEIGVRVEITFNRRTLYGFVLSIEETEKSQKDLEEDTGYKLRFIDKVVDEKPILNNELLTLAYKLKERYFYPLIGVFQTMLPPSLKPRESSKNAAKISYKYFYEVDKTKIPQKLSKNEAKLLSKFDNTISILKSEFSKSKTLTKFLDLGVIKEIKVEQNRYKINSFFNYEKEINLNEEQQNVVDEFENSNDSTYLLYGVTGSGKTEVYIKIIEKYLKNNKGVIVLVPEIALTPLMISRLYTHFENQIAVLHSSLTSGQKYDEYRKISSGEAKIVVGTRSAIFAPVQNLGLIIIDEENNECYKQDDQGLLFNAKDVAQIRIKINNGKIILGSATPSIESMVRAQVGSFHLLRLRKRFNELPLPRVQIVNKLDRNLFSYKSNIFSLPLIKEITNVIKNNEQAILLINSRGYGRGYYCRECGHVFKCPTCNLPLFYHKEKKMLYCHHCEYKTRVYDSCPHCGSTYFSTSSYGIEKVEEEFKKIFDVPYLVLDSDRSKTTYQIEKVLDDFNQNRAQILIGTQIISKGHDFKNVSFVGIIDVDFLINFPNFRSGEMTFSLITQTIGRCGRGDKEGKAIIQTSYPNDFCLLTAANQKYEEFYNEEIKKRKKTNYPPFINLLSITLESKKSENLIESAEQVKGYFYSLEVKDLKILGPSLIRFKRGVYITTFTIKYKKLSEISLGIKDLISSFSSNPNIKLRINFNPYSY